jgi:hypothetical protein
MAESKIRRLRWSQGKAFAISYKQEAPLEPPLG